MKDFEVNAGTVTNEEIEEKAKKIIATGYNGEVFIAFIDLLGFSAEILNRWKNEKKPLESLMKIKAFLELAAERSSFENFYSDDNSTIITTANYPKVITFSDSFIFITPLVDKDPNKIVASFALMTSAIMELWRFSVEEGFTIRGGMDYGEIYHNELDLVGPSLINSFNLESKIAKYSRIILSDNIRILIDNIFDKIDPSLHDYLFKFFRLDLDNVVALNPVIIFGYLDNNELDESIQKIKAMVDKLQNQDIRSKYDDLLIQLRDRNRQSSDRSIFKATK